MRKIQIPPSPASSRRGIRGRPGAFVQTRWLVGKTASHLVYFPSHPVRASSHLFFIFPEKHTFRLHSAFTHTHNYSKHGQTVSQRPCRTCQEKKVSTASIPAANDLKTLSANQWDPHFQPAPQPDAPDAGGHRQAPLQTPP